MQRNWKMNGAVVLSLMLGGCMGVKEEEMPLVETKDQFVSVQDYKGEEFTLNNGKETDKVAESHREEVEKAVRKFFQDEYKTTVKVNNLVGNEDGVTVYVESVGEPHFHTYAVVPIDTVNNSVLVDQVFSLEGEVENAITSGVYGSVYHEEFERLNRLIDEFTETQGFTGETTEAINNTSTFGYGNEYYYVSFGDMKKSDLILRMYLENPDTSRETWEEKVKMEEVKPESIYITLQLFKEQDDVHPTNEDLEKAVEIVKGDEGLPKGAYNILLHDNFIDVKTGIGSKESTIERSLPDYIIKE